MKIKNTRELRLRADSHTRADHVKQGTYGQAKVNGYATYRGCAIGCLSTPHRKRDLLRFLRDKLTKAGGEKHRWFELDNGSGRWQRNALADEFGICKKLAIIAEGCFEAQITHAQAINFVRDFAYALPEGVDIGPRDCDRFLRKQGIKTTVVTYGHIVEGIRRLVGWEPRSIANFGDGVEQFTLAFLGWLRCGARVSHMPREAAPRPEADRLPHRGSSRAGPRLGARA